MSVVDTELDARRPATLRLRLGIEPAFRPRPEIERSDHVLCAARHRGSRPPGIWSRSARGRAAEFPGLDPDATRHRVEIGLRLLRDAELDPAGFVAPGYAYTGALRQVLDASAHRWSADLGGVNVKSGGRIRARALGSSTPLKRALSPTVVLAAARGEGELMRLDVHPADFDLPGHVSAVQAVLELAQGRRVITYDDLGG
jgi:predicted deacetylase